MAIIPFPKFSPPAAAFWDNIDMSQRSQILTHVFCGKCRGSVEIVDYSGSMMRGDLLLKGKCAKCGHDIARFVEGCEPGKRT
jgi:hypothetical protein